MTAAAARRRYVTLMALHWLATGITIPVLVLLPVARGIDVATVGPLIGLFGVTVAVLELPTGGLADVLGRRTTMLLGVAAQLVATLGMAFAVDVWQFALVIVVKAVGRSLCSGSLEAWYVDTVHAAEPDASLRSGLSGGGAAEAVGLGVGTLLGGFLPGLAAGMPAGILIPMAVPMLLSAVLRVAGLVAFAVLMTEPPRTGPRPTASALLATVPVTVGNGLRLAAGDRVIRLLLVAGGGVGVAIGALELLFPVQLAAQLGDVGASGAMGVVGTLSWIGVAAGAALAPAASRLIGRPVPTAALFLLLAAGATALLAVHGGWLLAGVAYVAAYTLLGPPGPLRDELLHGRVGADRRATLVSVSSLVFQLTAALATAVLPAVATWAGFGAGWLVAAAALVVAAVATLGVGRAAGSRRATADTDLGAGQPVG